MSSVAMADTAVSAVTDLNVRAGPGPQYPIIGVLAAGQSAALNGCIEKTANGAPSRRPEARVGSTRTT